MTSEPRSEQRLDTWLWCARLVKSRTRAATLVREGRVRINRQPTGKPHARVRPGDVLTVPLGNRVRVLTVRAIGIRRGPASSACLLYDEVAEPPALLPAGDEAGIQPGRDRPRDHPLGDLFVRPERGPDLRF
jgi:ribosome-associated heat shock protein Hsp15